MLSARRLLVFVLTEALGLLHSIFHVCDGRVIGSVKSECGIGTTRCV